MDDHRESKNVASSATDSTPVQIVSKDDANAAIAWYLSEEFEERLGHCFEEGKRKALDARDAFLRSREASSTNEPNS